MGFKFLQLFGHNKFIGQIMVFVIFKPKIEFNLQIL
jgi:hypothetical protein